MMHNSSCTPFAATALFATRGIRGQAFLEQDGEKVLVRMLGIMPSIPSQSIRWQIHELPVDLSVDPKLRCRPEHVGRYLQYSGNRTDRDYIYGVTTASLVLHSLVLFANNELATCASIVPIGLPDSAATIELKMGVFGRIYIVQWPSKYIIY